MGHSLMRDSAASPTKRQPSFYSVPAGTPSTRCRGATCGATIYFVRNPSTGRMVPVHCDVEGGRRPSDTNDPSQADMFSGPATVYDGKGISHFLDCPDADQFSRGAR